MIPGWYDDPFAAVPELLRWWDGTTWTSHVTSKAALAPAPAAAAWALFAPDPRRDLEDELSSARLARVAMVVSAVVSAGYGLLSVWLFRDLRTQLRAIADGRDSAVTHGLTPGETVVAYAGQLVSIAALAAIVVWLYRAATLARRSGLPARRQTGWAIGGFFVPVVNLWFPYQVAADCLRPDDPSRRVVGAWWTFWLMQQFGLVVTIVTSLFSGSAGLIAGLITAVVAALAAYTGIRMIDAIGGAHRRLLAPT